MPLTSSEYIRQLINRLGADMVAKILQESDHVKQELNKKGYWE
jgi:hypothetical protein